MDASQGATQNTVMTVVVVRSAESDVTSVGGGGTYYWCGDLAGVISTLG